MLKYHPFWRSLLQEISTVTLSHWKVNMSRKSIKLHQYSWSFILILSYSVEWRPLWNNHMSSICFSISAENKAIVSLYDMPESCNKKPFQENVPSKTSHLYWRKCLRHCWRVNHFVITLLEAAIILSSIVVLKSRTLTHAFSLTGVLLLWTQNLDVTTVDSDLFLDSVNGGIQTKPC